MIESPAGWSEFPGLRRVATGSAAIAGLLLILFATSATGQTVTGSDRTLSIGGYYSKGDYGSRFDTTIRYFPLRYQHQIQRWRLAVVVPYLELEGLGNVLVNVGGVSRAGQYGLLDSDGLGDVLVSATYQVDPLFGGGTFLDLGLEVKLPTADERDGLGSGEYDYNLRADLFRNLGSVMVFGAAGYRIRGESSLYPGLEDSVYAEFGLQGSLTRGISVGLIYSYSEPPARYSYELHELLPYLNWQLDEHWSVNGYGAWGFTEDSPDLAIGLQVNYRW